MLYFQSVRESCPTLPSNLTRLCLSDPFSWCSRPSQNHHRGDSISRRPSRGPPAPAHSPRQGLRAALSSLWNTFSARHTPAGLFASFKSLLKTHLVNSICLDYCTLSRQVLSIPLCPLYCFFIVQMYSFLASEIFVIHGCPLICSLCPTKTQQCRDLCLLYSLMFPKCQDLCLVIKKYFYIQRSIHTLKLSLTAKCIHNFPESNAIAFIG